MLTPLVFVVIAALIFDYINGDRVRPSAGSAVTTLPTTRAWPHQSFDNCRISP